MPLVYTITNLWLERKIEKWPELPYFSSNLITDLLLILAEKRQLFAECGMFLFMQQLNFCKTENLINAP